MADAALERVKKRITEKTFESIYPEEMIHSENTLEWVLKLDPEADEAMRVAALGHDIERAFADKRIHTSDYDNYDEYKQAHALNSAQIMSQIMEECGVEQNMVDEIARLVAHHEFGGDEREELLKNADTLSFFHVCLPFYYDRKGPDITRKRSVWCFKRLPEELHGYVRGFDYMDEELRELIHECLGFGE